MKDWQNDILNKFVIELSKLNDNKLHDINIIKINIDDIDLTNLLNSDSIYYRSNRKEILFTKVYKELSLFIDENENKKVHDHIQDFLNNGIDLFYYSRFDLKSPKEELWKDFGDNQIIVPRLYFTKNFSNVELKFIFSDNEFVNIRSIFSICLDELEKNNEENSNSNSIINRSFYPENEDWEFNINKVLKLIKDDKYQKIVQARKHTIEYSQNPDPIEVFKKLAESQNETHLFYIHSKDSVFLGASPELLFSRISRLVSSDSLAGTRKRTGNVLEDNASALELINNPKELREQQIVKDEIYNRLKSVSDRIEATPLRVKKLKHLMHLHNTINAKINEDVSDFDLINKLHPTPAVGSLPNDNSSIINEIEKWDRGLYAAPIGIISKDNSEIIVAIRSALIHDNSLTIFSGAGIVEGSEPEKEWEEINHKMKNFLAILDNDIN